MYLLYLVDLASYEEIKYKGHMVNLISLQLQNKPARKNTVQFGC